MRTNIIYPQILLLAGATMLAVPSSLLAQSFPIGWFDADWHNPHDPTRIFNTTGAEHIVLYTYWGTGAEDRIQNYLDAAAAAGKKVILDISNGFVYNLDVTQLTNVVNKFGNHPGLGGWYTADEPYDDGVPLATLQTAYDIIKQHSSKPVYMAFCPSDLEHNTPVNYKNAYDVMMYDKYPFQVGDAEFDNIEDEWFELFGVPIYRTYEGWKSRIQNAHSQAVAAGKPFYNILQAFGVDPFYGWDARLPTKREERFLAYYSLISAHVDGLTFFCYFGAEGTIASPTEPYPYDGQQWISDVGTPVIQELLTYGRALAAGEIEDGVSDTAADVDCELYRDPTTGKYYLLSINTEAGGETVTFSVSGEFDYAIPMYEDGSPIPIINGQFTVSFDDYAVHNYLLTPEPATLSLLVLGAAGIITKQR